ncbi:major vault protein alpha-like [Lingula anatina]|uniref:Major vault protein n=1 Tax=Lingula anatina TaxID=7574 RepID=A0A1S3IHR7_LINAN|nr:major vault protein alpha-like [Lingula anatina]|eukprot:XP_013397805.1 major vault protein alpha-like [Lingula anatina]
MGSNIIGLPPHHFVHIIDFNTNVTKLEVGPNTVVLQSNEKLQAGPLPCIVVPPAHYCIIKDPMSNYVHGKKCELRLGYFDVRFHGEPFPLYPGEVLQGARSFGTSASDTNYSQAIKPLPVVKANHAIRLKALQDFDDGGVERKAGDMWQLEGPLTYKPTPNADIVGMIKPLVIGHNQALLLRAQQGFTDKDGIEHVTGEEWLVRRPGAYLPDVYAEDVELRNAIVLTENVALHLQADQTLVDSIGTKRLAGEEWLITLKDTESYIQDVGVTVKASISKTVVSRGQYCVVLDPQDKHGRNQMGKRELRKGVCSFFLKPGERLEDGVIKQSYIMGEDESLVLKALDKFEDTVAETKVKRKPGDRWMINGPMEYIPPIDVEVMDRRKAIPLNKNEGVYVRNEETGEVRSVMGPCAYMLKAYEVLWNKELTDSVELLLKHGGGYGKEDIRKIAYFEQSIDPSMLKGRDKTRVVTYRCPGNTAVQIYNYKKKTARVIFGPDLVVLGPHENFNVLSLSAGKPKKPHALQSLCLMLGPDFITDILEVETSDHARLSVKIAFNNYFQVERGNPKSEASIFNVPDFIGYACSQIGSRIRAQVAQIPFDQFHRHSAQIIKTAVFGYNKEGNVNEVLVFPSNSMVVTNVDIQSIEPVDVKMKDSLSKSVQMAIEIATKSIERSAAHEAMRSEQIAKGQLERQKLQTEREAEIERAKLYELRNIAAAVESTGQAKAEAQAQAEKTLIEAQSEIEVAQLKALAEQIEHNAQLHTQGILRSSELSFQKSQNELETSKARELTNVEISKFSSIVSTLGADTLAAIANSGPETQAKLLQGLGLESVLITDGNSPINLFNTAEGLIGATKG